MTTIDKHVPIPNEDLGRSKGYAERIRSLTDSGDSVFLETGYLNIANTARRILGSGGYVIRPETNPLGAVGVRIWKR